MSDTGTFNIQIVGLPALIAKFKDSPSVVGPILQNAVAGSAALLAKYTTRGPVPFRTGALLQSFRSDTSQPYVARWFPTINYAPYVYFGTGMFDPAGPHLIYPKSATVMAWKGADGKSVFARYTRGMKGNPYLDTVAAAANPEIQALFQAAAGKIASALAT